LSFFAFPVIHQSLLAAVELVDKFWRREWAHYKEKTKEVPGGSLALSPNETKHRTLTMKSVREFDTSMKRPAPTFRTAEQLGA
jgi:hypothetical protein